MMENEAGELAGFRIASTAARRGDELADLLRRRGAEVISAPALNPHTCVEDDDLRVATQRCIDSPPDILLASTGVGLRGWFEAARSWGVLDDLVTALGPAEILARGPKAVGALRRVGLRETWAGESESMDEVLAHLADTDLTGTCVAVQAHGIPHPLLASSLRQRGADVVVITTYRTEPATDLGPLLQLVRDTVDRRLDAVVFTSAPAAEIMGDVAGTLGLRGALIEAFRTDVVAACVGPVTAAVWEAHGVPTLSPARFRLAALVRTITEELPRRRRGRVVDLAGHRVVVTSADVLVDGVVRPLTPGQRALFDALATCPGRVVSRAELLKTLPSGTGSHEHAVEAAVARLRTALGGGLVRTVVKRGYRLAAD